MKNLFLSIGVLCVVSLSVGCPSDGGGGGNPDAGTDGGNAPVAWSLGETCQKGWQLFCEKQADCGFIANAAECTRVGVSTCDGASSPVGAAIGAGRVHLDGDAARTCFESLANATCLTPWDQLLASPECRGYFGGDVADGQPCYSSGVNECATGVCLREGGVCPGLCSAWIDIGNDCTGDKTFGCRLGTYCDGSVCQLRSELAGACNTLLPWSCAAGLSCVGSGTGVTGTCKTTAADTQACTSDGDCLWLSACVDGSCHKKVATAEHCVVDWSCPQGELCYDADGDYLTPTTCAPPIALDQTCVSQQPCADGLACILDQATGVRSCIVDTRAATCALCTALEWCDTSAGQILCFPLGTAGDVCDSVTLEGCGDGFYCDTSYEECTALLPLDEFCSNGGECASGVCGTSGKCSAVCSAP